MLVRDFKINTKLAWKHPKQLVKESPQANNESHLNAIIGLTNFLVEETFKQ